MINYFYYKIKKYIILVYLLIHFDIIYISVKYIYMFKIRNTFNKVHATRIFICACLKRFECLLEISKIQIIFVFQTKESQPLWKICV